MIHQHDDEEKADLSNIANSFLHTKVLSLQDKRLHIVRHGNLHRPEGKDRANLYRDGKHLTNLGLKQYSNNIIKTMGKVLTIKEVQAKTLTKLELKVATKSKYNEVAKQSTDTNPIKTPPKKQQVKPKWSPKWTPLPWEPPAPLTREPPQPKRYQGQTSHQYQKPQYSPLPPHQTGYWGPPSSPPLCSSPAPSPPHYGLPSYAN